MYFLSIARPRSLKDSVRSCTIVVNVSGYYELAVPFADAAVNIGPDTLVRCGNLGAVNDCQIPAWLSWETSIDSQKTTVIVRVLGYQK